MVSPLYKLRVWYHAYPRRFVGGYMMNVLGLHLLRMLWLNARQISWHMPPKNVRKYTKEIKRDGVVLIPNFLPDDIFQKIKEEFEKEESKALKFQNKTDYAGEGAVRSYKHALYPEPNSNLSKLINKHLTKNQLLLDLFSIIMDKKIVMHPDPYFFIHGVQNKNAPDIAPTADFHSDIPYRAVKAFLYINDIDTKNGAFTYAKETHKLSLRRLIIEYKQSVRCARERGTSGDRKLNGDPKTGLPFHNLNKEGERYLKVVPTPMVGRANSLVVFNVRGYHRQGRFSDDRRRIMLKLSYRT